MPPEIKGVISAAILELILFFGISQIAWLISHDLLWTILGSYCCVANMIRPNQPPWDVPGEVRLG